MVELSVIVFFPALMAFAAFSDLFTMTISNRISLALVLGFAPLALALGASPALVLWHLSCGAAILALTFAMFSFGWIGGGDAKLAAATAVWLGWAHIFDYGVLSSLLGGLLTLVIVAARRASLPQALVRRGWIARLVDAKGGVPYGVALAAAGLALYPDTQIWLSAIGTAG